MSHTFFSRLFLLFYGLFFMIMSNYLEANPSLKDTQHRLNHIDDKIKTLHAALYHTQQQSEHIQSTLADNEKKIGDSIRTLKSMQEALHASQNKLLVLTQKIQMLQQQLRTHQQLLARHLQARYQFSNAESFLILLMQDDPQKSQHLLTLYHYLVKARYQAIEQALAVYHQLSTHQTLLKQEIAHKTSLEERYQSEQQKLMDNKHYHEALLQTLHQRLKTQQETLSEFQENRRRLTQLLQTLSRPATVVPGQVFTNHKQKMSYPIKLPKTSMLHVSHGLLLLAPEGTPVRAISAGRVVFSDWLKGYGLLIIIEHGQGLMSLYAHNQSLLKLKGSQVAMGEEISTVGRSGGSQKNGLYFELRQHGKVVSPLKWLS